MFTIATWNINGVKARIAQLTAWLPEAQPDVVVLQEIKTVDEGFPSGIIEDLGWRVWTHGQKSWNGVAILARKADPVLIRTALPGDAAEDSTTHFVDDDTPGGSPQGPEEPHEDPDGRPRF